MIELFDSFARHASVNLRITYARPGAIGAKGGAFQIQGRSIAGCWQEREQSQPTNY
jgi:hypothetical protein